MTEKTKFLGVDLLEILKDSSTLGIYVYQEDGRLVFANKAFCDMVGYSLNELLNEIKLTDLQGGNQKQIALKNMERRLKGEKFLYEYREIFYKTKDSSIKPVYELSYTITYNDKPAGLVMVFDITQQKVFEMLYQNLSDINQLIIRSEDEEELLSKICDILFSHMDFHLVVLGSIDKKTKLFKPKFIKGEERYVKEFKNVVVSVDESVPEGRGTTGRAYRTKQIAVSDNVFKDKGMSAWKEAQKKYGIHSICSIPIFKNNKIAYIIIIYSRIAGIFSQKYLSLIKEMQADISFALDKIEQNRELKMFNDALSASMNWVVVTDKDANILKASNAVAEISGYELNELLGENPRIFKSGYHSDEFYKNLWDTISSGKPFRTTFTNKRKDGSLFYLDAVIIPVVVQGKIERYVDISRDITQQVELSQKVEKISNLYKMLYAINQMILNIDSEETIITKLPQLIVDILGFKLSFVIKKGKKGDLNIETYYAKEDSYKQYIDFLKNSRDILPYIKFTPFFKSIKNRRVYLVNDILSNNKLSPFHEIIKIYNFNSCFSMPIVKNGKAVAAVVGISNQIGFFDKNICKLLEQIKMDISSYLDRLETEQWYDMLTNATNSGFDFVIITDENFRIVYANDNAASFSGYPKDEIIGRHHSMFSSKTHSRKFIMDFYNTLKSGKIYSGIMTYKTKDSRIVKALVNITPYKAKNNRTYYIATGRDVTESLEVQKAIEENLNKDTLTGLITRAPFINSLKQFIERAEYEKLFGAVAVINPIRLSSINHAYGFEVGNKLIAETAERLKAYFRKYDTIAKLESDKFGVIIKDLKNEEDVYIILIKLINHLSKPYIIDNKIISVSFNAGVSIYPKDAANAEILLDKAEIALLDVKNKEESLGFYKEDLKKIAQKRIRLKNDMATALKNREFILYYQPYFDIKTSKIKGAEALLRWKKDNKIIPPMEFIPYLEETGMISSVEDWIIEEVSNKQKQWESKNIKPIPISINISPVSFAKQDFTEVFISDIKTYKANPELINIEIIERLFIENLENSKKTLETLKKSGFHLSIDDFGTGYSSLSYLSSLPIDYIKIDISFVRKILIDNNTKAVVKAIISLSKDINMKTIAEGVETKEQLELLKTLGCDYVQGYLFSKPLPEDEFEKMLIGE